MLGISTTNVRVGGFRGGKKYSAEALSWRTNIIANGGTITDATLQIFDTNFFIPATANGNILTELDRLNIYCGLNGYEIAARTNLINSNFYVTPVSSPTFSVDGYKSSGTSYLNLNYNPKTQGVKFTKDSASLGYVVKNPTFLTQKRAMGAGDGVSLRTDVQRASSGSQYFINSISNVVQSLTPSGNVFSCGVRTSSTAIKAITNTTETSAVVNSVDIPNFNQFELCLNFGGTPLAPFDDISHMASFHGSASLDYANLRTILNNLFTALGV